MSKRKPPTPKKLGVYDTFGSLPAARNAYRRKRTTQHFILSEAAQKNLDPICDCCKKRLSEHDAGPGYDSNLCEYNPKTKQIKIMAYTCAWGATLQQVYDTADSIGVTS